MRKTSTKKVFDKKFFIDPIAIKERIAETLCGLDYNRDDDTVINAFKSDYLLRSLLAKLPVRGTPAAVRRQNALDSLAASEERLRVFNRDGFCKSLSPVLYAASKIVANVLGPFSYNHVRKARYSSGSSLTHRYSACSAWHKYSDQVPNTCTPSAYKFAAALIGNTPAWCAQSGLQNILLVKGNQVGTVPKKTEIDRTIAKEPDLNMYLQLAVGQHLRERLKRILGINLNDQTVNQGLAFEASVSDGMPHSLATIDLANASNSICWRLVFELLPMEWFNYLDAIRSRRGLLNSEYVEWEMFSSMGNGFTFELESLIFYALTSAIAQVNGIKDFTLSVYGDDIVVSTQVAHLVVASFPKFGFEINLDKTFITGPFYESCGKHYYLGIDVTPFYVRTRIDSIFRVIWLLNKIRLWSYCPRLRMCDPSLYELWKDIYKRYYPHKGGLCDINSSGSVYQYTSTRRVADHCVEDTRVSFKYDNRAYLAKWQSVTDDVLPERGYDMNNTPLEPVSVVARKGTYHVDTSSQTNADYILFNLEEVVSYGFPQEIRPRG